MEAKINKSAFVAAGIYIILGIVMIIWPETTMKTFCLVLGTIGVVLGMINLVSYFSRDVMDSVYKYDFAGGVIMILAGILFIVKMDEIIELIPMILGVLIIASGLIKLQHSIDLKRIEFNGWIYVLVFSLLCLSVGVVCVLQPEFIASTLVILLGISFLFCGITDLVTLVFLSKRMKEFTSGSGKETAAENKTDNEKEAKKRFGFGNRDKKDEAAKSESVSEDKTEESNEAVPEKSDEQAVTESFDIFKDSVTYDAADAEDENIQAAGNDEENAEENTEAEKADVTGASVETV